MSKQRLVDKENEVENEDDPFSTEDDSFTTQVVTDYSASYSASNNELTIGDSAIVYEEPQLDSERTVNDKGDKLYNF